MDLSLDIAFNHNAFGRLNFGDRSFCFFFFSLIELGVQIQRGTERVADIEKPVFPGPDVHKRGVNPRDHGLYDPFVDISKKFFGIPPLDIKFFQPAVLEDGDLFFISIL